MYSESFKWEGIAGPSLKQLSIFSFMHHFTSFYMQWVFFISQKIHLLKAEIMTFVVGKCLTKKKQWQKHVCSYLNFFLSFQLILFSLCQVFRHHHKYFHNFTNLKQEHKPSHFVLSHLWQEWGFIHKAFWNGLSIIGISTELANVLVISFRKEDIRRELRLFGWHPVISVNGPKAGVLWGLGEKEADCQTDFAITNFFLSCLSQEI